jgi:hypothetical protein
MEDRQRGKARRALSFIRDTGMGEVDQVKHWRLRATELRSIAEQFTVPSAQDTLRKLAARCDELADQAERAVAKGSRRRSTAIKRSPG